MAKNFRQLEIWQLSYQLVIDLYKITEKFPEKENSNLVSQIRRAATSVPLNIAEGCTRFSKKGFLQFLGFAYGSIRELEVLVELSKDLKLITASEYEELNEKVGKISRKLFTFIIKVEREKWFNWFKS